VNRLRLLEFFRFYEPGNPYHRAAIAELQDLIPAELLTRDASWFKVWSQAGKRD